MMISQGLMEQQAFLDDFVRDMFEKNGITEPTTEEVTTRYKQIIAPLKYSIEPIQSTRSIADIAKIPIARMPIFILDGPDLERGLVLKPAPREELTHTVVKFAGDTNAAVAGPPVKKQKRSSAGAGSSSSRGSSAAMGVASTGTGSGGTREVAYSYTAKAEALYSSTVQTKTIITPPITASTAPIPSAGTSSTPSVPASVSAPASVSTPEEPTIDLTVAYPKMKAIVTHFWELDLPDRFVNGAFFGRITALNYRDFGMDSYRHDFTNLIFIKDKMDDGRYFSYREFVEDFEAMFQRINDCFATSHDVLVEARALREKFLEMSAL